MHEGQTFSVDHDPTETRACREKHGEIPHERWVALEAAMLDKEAAKAEPEPWELNDFIQRANGHVPSGVRLAADIRIQFDRDQGQERFELWAFHDDDPDHTVVADFAVNPLVGTDWPRLRFMLSALKIAPATPWEIAGPIAALARERKVPVG